MTTAGWIFMILSWGVIIFMMVYSLAKIIGAEERRSSSQKKK